MKHANPDYDMSKIPEDEPVFLLRAQDELASEVVKFWAFRYRLRFGDAQIAADAETHANKMRAWTKKKRPD